MKDVSVICFAALLAAVSSAFVHEDGIVEVHSDNEGKYKYFYTTTNITVAEERNAEGYVRGAYSYIDDSGERQTVKYVAGVEGFSATGSIIPTFEGLPVEERPEVAEARLQHQRVAEQIASTLPKLKSGEDVVEERPIVPLTKKEHLAAVEDVLSPKYLRFAEDTPEIQEAKEKLYAAYATALA